MKAQRAQDAVHGQGMGPAVGIPVLDDKGVKIPSLHCPGEEERFGGDIPGRQFSELKRGRLAWAWNRDGTLGYARCDKPRLWRRAVR